MALRSTLSVALLALSCSPAFAADPAAVKREEVGNRVSENIPAIPAALLDKLNRYQNTRGAGLTGWTREGCLLISTRFAETAQVHRVCQPMGMREQLTFYPEPRRRRRRVAVEGAGQRLRLRQGQGRRRVLAVVLVRLRHARRLAAHRRQAFAERRRAVLARRQVDGVRRHGRATARTATSTCATSPRAKRSRW